jgi:hypothetical protein
MLFSRVNLLQVAPPLPPPGQDWAQGGSVLDGSRGWERDGSRGWERDGSRGWERDGSRGWERDGSSSVRSGDTGLSGGTGTSLVSSRLREGTGAGARTGAYPSRRPPGAGLAEATRLNALEHERRVAALREEQLEKEMQECTFVPRLHTAPTHSLGRAGGGGRDGDGEDELFTLDGYGSGESGDEDDLSRGASSAAGPGLGSSRASQAGSRAARLPVHERLYALKVDCNYKILCYCINIYGLILILNILIFYC